MLDISDIIFLGTAWILAIALLMFRDWQRRQQLSRERDWDGHGIDVTDVISGVERVRADPTSALQSRPDETRSRRDLLDAARRGVNQLSYFRRRAEQAEHDTPTHAA